MAFILKKTRSRRTFAERSHGQREQHGKPLAAVIIILLAACIASAIAVIHFQQQTRVLYSRLEEERNIRNELDQEYGRLLLEQSMLIAPERIEQIAAARGMRHTDALFPMMSRSDMQLEALKGNWSRPINLDIRSHERRRTTLIPFQAKGAH